MLENMLQIVPMFIRPRPRSPLDLLQPIEIDEGEARFFWASTWAVKPSGGK
jgi:hypothetical protein